MKLRSLKSLVLAVCVGSLSIPTVKAATINIQQDVDLATATVNAGPPDVLWQYFKTVTPIPIRSGDTVTLSFNFLNGRVMMENPSSTPSEMDYVLPMMVLTGRGGSVFRISNIEIGFMNAEATAGVQTHFSLESQWQFNETYSLGPALVNFLPSGSSLSFSGVQTSYSVDAITGGSGYYQPDLMVVADHVMLTPIPEPSTPALCTLGALLIGGRRLFLATAAHQTPLLTIADNDFQQACILVRQAKIRHLDSGQ